MSSVFNSTSFDDHEEVVFCNDRDTGLKAIIAIHNTVLGPALGGCRFWNYASEDEAITDVLRLAKGMTYKAAVAGLNLGGGKAVIMGDPKALKSEKFFRAFGRFVESLGGRYITAEDVNIKVVDLDIVATETRFVTGTSAVQGGSGDPSPLTALGVYHGIRAAVQHKLRRDSIAGLTVAVQGCGAVGRNLIRLLTEAGAKTIVSDINPDNTQFAEREYRANVVAADSIHRVPCDVFAPCALGGGLNKKTIPELKTGIVAGAANNQLLDERADSAALQARDILYAPDYVINAGGLMSVALELEGYSIERAEASAKRIHDTLTTIFNEAKSSKMSTSEASNRYAEQRIAQEKRDKNIKLLSHTYDNQRWMQEPKAPKA